MAVEIGGAEGGSYTKKKQFKIKDGDNVYRILPSLGFGGKKPNGRWTEFYNIHFGYKNSAGKMRVFQSPLVKNRDTKMIEKPDAALERIEKLKSELEKAKAAKNKALVDRLAPLISGQKPMYNMDNNHHCNAINENGEIGILKLRHKAKLALDAVIKQLRAKGIEPLGGDSGRFFVINRTGTGLETTFTVTVKKRTVTIEGQEFEQDIVHKLTPEIIARLESEAGELDNLYQRPTSEEVARIVSTSDLLTGKSPAVDEILDRSNDTAEEGEEEPTATTSTASAPAATVTPAPAPATSAPTQSLSQPAPAPTPTATAAVQVQATPAPQPTQDVSALSDEEFLKSIGA